MSEHTPGPWEANKSLRTSINAGPKHIAMVNFWHSDDERDVSGEEHEANARLITAAPELLAACELGKDWTPSGAVRCAAHELGAFGGSFDALRKLLYEKADAEEAAIARTKGDDDA